MQILLSLGDTLNSEKVTDIKQTCIFQHFEQIFKFSVTSRRVTLFPHE